jgi:hypothetical protein
MKSYVRTKNGSETNRNCELAFIKSIDGNLPAKKCLTTSHIIFLFHSILLKKLYHMPMQNITLNLSAFYDKKNSPHH